MIRNSADNWGSVWARHMEAYQAASPRQAQYLSYLLRQDERRLLELGSGSFRDIAWLGEKGWDVLGCDFSPDSVKAGKEGYPTLAERFSVMDATNLPLEDNAVDVSFHNGLFVCMDDTVIDQVLREQVRVSKSRIVVTVHNAENQPLRDEFRRIGASDDLYDIRFFDRAELRRLMGPHVRNVRMMPFGLPKFDRWRRDQGGDRRWKMLYRASAPLWPWDRVERIMAIGEC